jgi:hypothetical protein
MEQDGLQASGAPVSSLTTATSHIMEVLRLHRTALQCRTNNIREMHSIAVKDITDSKAVSSFNPQRTLILAAVATRSLRHHKALHQLRDMAMMEPSDDDLKGAEEIKELES